LQSANFQSVKSADGRPFSIAYTSGNDKKRFMSRYRESTVTSVRKIVPFIRVEKIRNKKNRANLSKWNSLVCVMLPILINPRVSERQRTIIPSRCEKKNVQIPFVRILPAPNRTSASIALFLYFRFYRLPHDELGRSSRLCQNEGLRYGAQRAIDHSLNQEGFIFHFRHPLRADILAHVSGDNNASRVAMLGDRVNLEEKRSHGWNSVSRISLTRVRACNFTARIQQCA